MSHIDLILDKNSRSHFFKLVIDIFPIILLIIVLFTYIFFAIALSRIPATDQDLYDAKKECPLLSNYLKLDKVIMRDSLSLALFYCSQDAKDKINIAHQHSILKNN